MEVKMKNRTGKKFGFIFKTLPFFLLTAIFFWGCIAAIPIAVYYYKTDKNYVATATVRKSADDVWLAVLRLGEEAETERGVKILKKDATGRLLEATDGVQTAEVKVLDEGRRKSRIVITADVPSDDKEKELVKEKELAARIMKNICEEAKAECKLVEE
jgi:hypothetical protein